MKAFKTINISFERKIVASYTSFLCLLCSFIALSPVFSQDDYNNRQRDKEQHTDNYTYDEDGNVILSDSVFCHSWKKFNFHSFNHDSMFDGWADKFQNFNEYIRQNFPDSSGFYNWKWPSDSSGYAYNNFKNFDHFLDKEIDIGQFLPDEKFWNKLEKNNDEFMEKFREYHEEHKKLLEKYFRNELPETGSKPEDDQEILAEPENNSSQNSTGSI